ADEVLLGKWRHHQERNAESRTAASGDLLATESGRLSCAGGAAIAGAVRGVSRREGRAGDHRRDVVVLTIRVVICEDDGRALPVRLLLQEVDQDDQTGLLVERVGILRMTILERRLLDEGNGREVAGTNRLLELFEII